MNFFLNNDEMQFLEEYAKDAIALLSIEEKQDNKCVFSADYDNLIDELTFAVLEKGMDNEDTINKIGKRLYYITDKIVAQKNNLY